MTIQMRREQTGLRLVKKPSQSAGELQVVREATTGRVVVFSHTGNLPKVWAVAEPMGLVEAHVSEARHGTPEGVEAAPLPAPKAEMAFYRKYTEAMLRRYLRMSTEVGRVPSLLGRELFRGNVTHCKVNSFEDVVIFCHDMEKLIGKLRPLDQQLLKRIALQQYSQGEAAGMLGMSHRTCRWSYGQSLDRLTEMLLEARMLEPQKCCQ